MTSTPRATLNFGTTPAADGQDALPPGTRVWIAAVEASPAHQAAPSRRTSARRGVFLIPFHRGDAEGAE